MYLRYAVDRREILDWLLDQGIDINGGTNEIMPGVDRLYRDHTVAVLNQAAAVGDIELFDHLVARGAKPSRSNALHKAACSKNAPAMITHLIEKYNLDVNADDGCGGVNELVEWHTTGSPLNYAASRSNIPAIETLLKYGANIGGAYQFAIKNKNTPTVKLFLDSGVDPSECLGSAIINDHLEAARLCLEYGGDIAVGEAHEKMVAGIGGVNTVMGSEMRKLLDEWN
jgi:hypothetical protein